MLVVFKKGFENVKLFCFVANNVVDVAFKLFIDNVEFVDNPFKFVNNDVDVEFNYDNMISTWDKTIESTLDNWTYNKPVQWELQEIGIVNHVLDVQRQLPPQQQAATSNPITSNVVQKLKINQPRGITK